jgi:hypothetical protein
MRKFGAMKTCIICRLPKEDFNDEHVIPDAIQGYYHIRSVCRDCNSTMGSKIDSKLTNHKFMEFQRELLGIKGKSGNIPNPMAGTHALEKDPTQKVQIHVDKRGHWKPRLLPKVPDKAAVNGSFSITIDQNDKAQLEKIVEKFLKRNGIPKERVKMEITYNSTKEPILVDLDIDILEFKMALLKIAYEFTIDQLPTYFNDPSAQLYAGILKIADAEALHTIPMIGNGFSNDILTPFAHLLDFHGKNHYLILIDGLENGLFCVVSLFNLFNISFKMSDQTYLEDNILVGKNDRAARAFEIYDLDELVDATYSAMEQRFKYVFKTLEAANEFLSGEPNPQTDFHREQGTVSLFDSSHNIKYLDIQTKLLEPQLKHVPHGDITNEIITEIELDEELYIKVVPTNTFVQIKSVSLERTKIKKL